MSALPWWLYSIVAAVIWGLHFNLVARIMKVLPNDVYAPLTLFMVTAVPVFILLPFMHKKIFDNVMLLWQADNNMRLSVLVLIFTTVVAACLLYIAMQLSPNPTVAALLDITYPLFIALIAWLLFKESHLDWSVLVGGGMILCGAMLIVWKHG